MRQDADDPFRRTADGIRSLRQSVKRSFASLQQTVSEAQQDKRAIYRFASRILPLVVMVSLLTAAIHELGWLQGLETTSLDTLIRLTPLTAKHVFVVAITDEDYKDLFAARSPLASDKVAELIRAAAVGEPKVIVVDLDTSAESFRGLKLPETTARIVWARGASIASSEDPVPAAAQNGPVFLPDKLLGASAQEPGICSGISVLPADPEGIIRHYSRYVLTADPSSPRSVSLTPTLPWAAALAYRDRDADRSERSETQMVLAYSGGQKFVPHISAGNLLAICNGQGWKDAARDKIVLLGGNYQAARDTYNTPVGAMPGVEIVAEAIESELQRGGIRPVSQSVLILAQVLASILVAAINYLFVRTWVPFAGLIAIPAAAFAFSLISFSSLYLWVDFVPALLAVQLYYLLEHIRKSGERNREARTDVLTGLHNKRYLFEILPQVFKRAGANPGQRPVSIIMIDGDHFKAINDTHGHKVGDQMLQELGKVIRSCVRSQEAEGFHSRSPDHAIRFGGEEFMVVMENADSRRAVKVAERIRNAVESNQGWPAGVSSWTVSLGVATFPEDGCTADQLVESADRALYYVKNELGRNQVCHARQVPSTARYERTLPALRGEMGGFDAAGLLQSIGISQKTGVLTVRTGSGQDLWALFQSGKPVQARLGKHAGPAAITEFLVTFENGSFNFQERRDPKALESLKLDGSFNVERSLERCLMDGALAHDHYKSARIIIPTPHVYVVPQPHEEFTHRWYALTKLKEPPSTEEFNCMSEIVMRAQGNITLSEIFAQLEKKGIPTHLFWRAAGILVENGLVFTKPTEQPAPV